MRHCRFEKIFSLIDSFNYLHFTNNEIYILPTFWQGEANAKQNQSVPRVLTNKTKPRRLKFFAKLFFKKSEEVFVIKIKEFERIVKEHEKFVFSICYNFTGDVQIAQDLAQETFISAYTNIANCTAGQYKPWLARIATNKAKDYLKSAYYKKVGLSFSAELEQIEYENSSTQHSPLDIAIQKDEINDVLNIINSLKEPYLFVSQMYFLQGIPTKDISLRLKRPEKTVRTQIYRAKNIIITKLEERGIRQNE